jgi:RNA-directed DNA polymerase
MYEKLMEEVVSPENYGKALKAVITNDGAPGIDGMRTEELNGHLLKHWPKIQAKLMAGTYMPSPVRRKEIEKPGGGMRALGTDGTGSVHPADDLAGNDTDLGAEIQRA